jgi:hypothetical protein
VKCEELLQYQNKRRLKKVVVKLAIKWSGVVDGVTQFGHRNRWNLPTNRGLK